MKRRTTSLLIAMQMLAMSAPLAGLAHQFKTSSPGKANVASPRKIAQFNSSAPADNAKMKEFIDALMSKMTLEEKIGQLNQESIGFDVTGPVVSQGVEEKVKKGLVGSVLNTFTPEGVRKLQALVDQSRLKIPILFGYDVIHGHRTIFPIPLGLSSSWNMDLIERTARAAALEASADGINWTFSPMVDIARDPRWGRVSECSGEDAYLGSQIAKRMVHGYQGDDLADPKNILACIKHFALYGAIEAGRDYNTVDMSNVRMYNEYLPPYKAAVDAEAATVMTSFNEINGVPSTGNRWLLTELLRNQWGFKGFVVTDYTAIPEMIKHGMGDEKTVTKLALDAGVDMDMVGDLFVDYGPDLVRKGAIPQAEVDTACRRVLEAKYKLGLFSNPTRGLDEEKGKDQIMSMDKLKLSQEAAAKSMVLLRNANDLLPLSTDGKKKIAFIGPLVKDQRNLIGNWCAAGDWKKSISLWEAIEGRFPNTAASNISYARGCNLVDDPTLLKKLNKEGGDIALDSKTPQQMIDEAVSTAKGADVVVAVLGEPFGMSGEAASRSNIGLLDNQMALLKALKATGKRIVLVLMNGRPLTLSWENENVDSIIETWFGGTEVGAAISDVLFGDVNPSGRLTMSFPRNVGQIPIYYNHKNTGRPFDEEEKYHSKYLDVSNEPLYPFGYGLSYTTFTCSEPKLSAASMSGGGSIKVSCTVSNTGKRDGIETVQLYVRDMVGSITRPVKELKGFKQLALKAGESKDVDFELTENDLKFYNSDLKFVSEPGDFKVFVGLNSRDTKEAPFKLTSN